MERLDFQANGTIFEVKRDVRGARDIQTALMQLARYVAANRDVHAALVLPNAIIREDRLRDEWEQFKRVARPKLVQRLRIIGERDGQYFGIPTSPDARITEVIKAHLAQPRRSTERPDRIRQADFWYFTVLKLLIHRLVQNGDPMRMMDLAAAAGCTYTTVKRVLDSLGSILERSSDRGVRLRWFPRPEFARMAAVAPRIRRTRRFVDRSVTPRTAEQHRKRLSRLGIADVAIGGIIGARHYATDLDILGTPHLDLSMGPSWKKVDDAAEELARRLDPALIATRDPLAPAAVVLHQVPHAIDLFVREGQILYADPIDCLLDLHEARLDGPARELLKAITKETAP